eukprot:scaffold32404_cov77-Phaeocystis_antarctica.AAC.2
MLVEREPCQCKLRSTCSSRPGPAAMLCCGDVLIIVQPQTGRGSDSDRRCSPAGAPRAPQTCRRERPLRSSERLAAVRSAAHGISFARGRAASRGSPPALAHGKPPAAAGAGGRKSSRSWPVRSSTAKHSPGSRCRQTTVEAAHGHARVREVQQKLRLDLPVVCAALSARQLRDRCASHKRAQRVRRACAHHEQVVGQADYFGARKARAGVAAERRRQQHPRRRPRPRRRHGHRLPEEHVQPRPHHQIVRGEPIRLCVTAQPIDLAQLRVLQHRRAWSRPRLNDRIGGRSAIHQRLTHLAARQMRADQLCHEPTDDAFVGTAPTTASHQPRRRVPEGGILRRQRLVAWQPHLIGRCKYEDRGGVGQNEVLEVRRPHLLDIWPHQGAGVEHCHPRHGPMSMCGPATKNAEEEKIRGFTT